MLYALLIYQAEEVLDNYSDADEKDALAGHRALQNNAKAAGHFVEANQLLPSSSAATVRRRNGHLRISHSDIAEPACYANVL